MQIYISACFMIAVVSCPVSAQISPISSPSPLAAKILMDECQSAMGSVDGKFSLTGAGHVEDIDHGVTNAQRFTFTATGRTSAIWDHEQDGKHLRRVVRTAGSTEVSETGIKRQLPSSEGIYSIPEFVPAYACNLAALLPSGRITYFGTAERAGVITDHLRISMGNTKLSNPSRLFRFQLQTYDLYLDSSSHRIVSLVRTMSPPEALENAVLVEYVFRDYVPLNNVQIPHTIEMKLAGRRYTVKHLDRVSEHDPIDTTTLDK